MARTFDIPFTPAGYAFSIWALIYAWLTGFTIWQATPRGRRQQAFDDILPLWLLSCAANAGWLVAWHARRFPLSLLAMLTILLPLAAIVGRLAREPRPRSRLGWLLGVAPFSLYLGWISVATIANVAYVLKAAGWSGWGVSDAAWATVMVLVAGLLGLVMLFRRRDSIFAATIAWAAVAIAVKRGQLPTVRSAAWLVAIGLGLAAVAWAVRTVWPRSSERGRADHP